MILLANQPLGLEKNPMHETFCVAGRGMAKSKDGDFRMRWNEK
jgi:hypothetical protein